MVYTNLQPWMGTSWTRGHLDDGGTWYASTLCLHRNLNWKIIWNTTQTWDSNPGLGYCQERYLPAEPFELFDILITHKQQKERTSALVIKSAKFKISESLMDNTSSSSLFLKHERMATVFWAWLKGCFKKIAIRPSTLINWARGFHHLRLQALSLMALIWSSNFALLWKPQIENLQTLEFSHGRISYRARNFN